MAEHTQPAGQAQQKAQEAAGQARGMAREQVDQRSTELGQRVRSNADDVRAVGDQLREQGKEGPARIAGQAADRAERLGRWLEQSDGDRLMRDVEDFGRRNAWAVAAGGVALGFAAARFLKASSRDRYRESLGDGVPPERRTGEIPETTATRPPAAGDPGVPTGGTARPGAV